MQDVNEWNDRVREPDPAFTKKREVLDHEPTDRDLEEAVSAKIMASGLEVANLKVRVIDREVALLGLARTEDEKTEIGELALGVAGVDSVVNDLQVLGG